MNNLFLGFPATKSSVYFAPWVLLFAVFYFTFIPFTVYAQPEWIPKESTRDVVRTTLDSDTIARGFTLETPQKKLRVGVTPNAVGERDVVQVRLKSLLPSEVDIQDQVLLSNVYVYDIFNEDTVPVYQPIWVSIQTERMTDQGGVLKMWDSNVGGWIEVPSSYDPQTGEMRAALHLPYAILAVFEFEEPEYTGQASWYDWYGAAMNVYDMGDVVQVTNSSTGATVTTTIVSRGPYTPGRIIDLPRGVFAAIGDVSQGVMDVEVQRVTE